MLPIRTPESGAGGAVERLFGRAATGKPTGIFGGMGHGKQSEDI
jgi:hypothetical protein